jgi:hypothetical protein
MPSPRCKSLTTTNHRQQHRMTTPNTIPQSLDPLEISANHAEAGARSHGVAVGLKHNLAADIQLDKEAAFGRRQDPLNPDPNAPIGKRAEHAQARAQAADARTGLRAALDAGREYCADATDILRPLLGRRWNSKWHAAGFAAGSLRQTDPVPRLGLFRAYFRLHPEHENVALKLTAAEADVQLAAIETAQSNSANKAALEATVKQERDEAIRQLRRRLSGLRSELDLLLGDDDPRWYQFGFSRPADGRIPAPVFAVTAESAGPGALQVRWDRSALADNYRVSRRIQNVDLTPVEVGLFSDPLAIVSGLPTGATVIILVTARNSAGETLPTEVQAIVG